MSDDYMCPNCETEARAISILTAAVFGDQETPKWFRDRVNDVAEAAREQGRRAALDAVEPPDGPDTRAGQTFWDENAHRVDLPAVSAPPEPPDGPEVQRRMRALHCLLRYREPGQTPYRRVTRAMEADLLGWAATLDDAEILDMRGVGPALLAWIREHQPNESQAGEPRRMLGMVMQETGWRVEIFWNASAGWFTARLFSLVDKTGYLAPFDDPIGVSGATPEEALHNLYEAVLEWA